jgi:hypothetical protein
MLKEAKYIEAVKDFYRLIGEKWRGKPEDIAKLKAGEVANRLTGKAAAEAQRVFNNLDAMAETAGYKNKVNTYDLVFFKDLLEKEMGITQRGGLAGQVQLGLQPEEMVSTAKGGFGKLIDAVTGKVLELGKISPEEKASAIRNLLKK